MTTPVSLRCAMASDLTDRLPGYETHLSRELDRALRRYGELQERRQVTIEGQVA